VLSLCDAPGTSPELARVQLLVAAVNVCLDWQVLSIGHIRRHSSRACDHLPSELLGECSSQPFALGNSAPGGARHEEWWSMARILLASADEEVRGFLWRLSRRRVPDAALSCTHSGLEALDLLRRAQYCVGVVDQDLAHLSGLEAIRRARWRGVRTPLVLLAGGATRALALRARQVGAQDLLEKPVLVAQYDAVLRDFVGAHRLQSDW